MSLSINFSLTKTGQAALFNASLTGYSVNLTHVQIGSGNRAPTGLETALLSPIETVAIAAGSRVSETQVRMSAIFIGNAAFPINEVGLWSGAPGVAGSVLVAYWSQATGSVAYKSAGVDFVFSHDLAVSPATNITVLADASQSVMLTLLGSHEAKPDPHPNYTTVSEVQALIEARVGDYVASTGPANAYVCTLVPSVTAYDEKTAFAFKVSAANTGACSLNAGGGAKPLVREDGTALQAGDLGAGVIATVVYDVATQSFRLTEIVASQINSLSDAKIAAHAAAADPHPQYETAAESAAKITAHKAEVDPHPQYTTAGELASAINAAAAPGRIYFFSQI